MEQYRKGQRSQSRMSKATTNLMREIIEQVPRKVDERQENSQNHSGVVVSYRPTPMSTFRALISAGLRMWTGHINKEESNTCAGLLKISTGRPSRATCSAMRVGQPNEARIWKEGTWTHTWMVKFVGCPAALGHPL